MERADEIKERNDRSNWELRKLSLEQQLSLTEVDQICIAKDRSVVGIIKIYERKLWEWSGRLQALFQLYWASRGEHTGPSKDQIGQDFSFIMEVVEPGWWQDTKVKCVHFYSENSKRQKTNKREVFGHYGYELWWLWEHNQISITKWRFRKYKTRIQCILHKGHDNTLKEISVVDPY